MDTSKYYWGILGYSCPKSEIASNCLMCRSLSEKQKKTSFKFSGKRRLFHLGVEKDFLMGHRKLKQTIRKQIDNIAQLKFKKNVYHVYQKLS